MISEIARLRAEIASEYAAAQRGLHGLSAGSSQHAFITAKLERVGGLYEQLAEIDKEAAPYLVEVLDGKVHRCGWAGACIAHHDRP